MKNQLELELDEISQLQATLDILSSQAHQSLSADSLFESWSTFITNVENTYDDSIYEYINDLSVRDLIQTLIDKSPEKLQAKLNSVITPLDNRFRDASRQSLKCIIDIEGRTEKVEWWWYRIPKYMGSELSADLADLVNHKEP